MFGRLSLNVSVLEFMQRDMVVFVHRAVDETGCRAEWLTLELTENLMAPEPENIHRAFEDLRRLGILAAVKRFCQKTQHTLCPEL